MFKKLLKLVKFLIIGIVWSVLWFVLLQKVVLYIWNFNFFSKKQWDVVASFWNANGTIKGLSDYMLFLTLFGGVIIWGLGFRYFYKKNYWQLLLKPFEYFSDKQIEKYSKEGKHVVIKNLVVGEKITLDDLIEQKIKEEDNQKTIKESETLRQNISQKIIERKGQ